MQGHVSVLATRLLVEGPIVPGRASFLVSGRRTHVGLLVRDGVVSIELVWHWAGSFPETAEQFYSLYFAMTGLHATHMVIGIAILGVRRILRSRMTAAN